MNSNQNNKRDRLIRIHNENDENNTGFNEYQADHTDDLYDDVTFNQIKQEYDVIGFRFILCDDIDDLK